MHPEDSSTSSTMIRDDSKLASSTTAQHPQRQQQHPQNQQQQHVGTSSTAAAIAAAASTTAAAVAATSRPLHQQQPQQQQQQQSPLTPSSKKAQSQQQQSNQQPQHPRQPQQPPNQNTKQQAWFQSSVLTRTEAYIEAQVLQLTEECRLFSDNNNTNNNNSINEKQKDLALLQRHEIQTSWTMLGNGAFSEVYTVTSIRLLDNGFNDPTQRKARQGLRDAVEDKQRHHHPSNNSNNNKQYVMKHLRRDLLQNRKKFVHAAGDLVLEAMYLSRLHHRNIIELKGCAVGGPSAYGDGRHDGFFLILERLQCTLSQRIQEWRNHSSNNTNPTSPGGSFFGAGGIVPSLSSPSSSKNNKNNNNNNHPTPSPTNYNNIYSSQLKDFEHKLDIAHQVAEALAYLHSRDIIFRDLKPDNIGIAMNPGDGPSGAIVKLFDFGLCRELPQASPSEDQVFHMSGVGTRRYMAPEVFLGQYYNVKADVYSWTMVLHAMLSLQRPYEMYTADLHKMLVCQEGVRPTIFQHWPSSIQSILRSGWDANSAERPSMQLVCDHLKQMLSDIKATKEYEARYAAENQNVIDPTPGAADVSGSVTTTSIPEREQPEEEETLSYDSIASFIESWTNTLCARTSQTDDGDGSVRDDRENVNAENNITNNTNNKKPPQPKKSLLRTLEAHLVADTAAGGQMMLRHSQSAYNGGNRWGTPDRDYQNQFAKHLRSSYL